MIVTRFRSTCFDFSSDRLLPEILTFPMVTEVRSQRNKFVCANSNPWCSWRISTPTWPGLNWTLFISMAIFPSRHFRVKSCTQKMISDIVLYMYDGKGSKSPTILWHWSTVSYLMIVDAIFTGLFARPPVLREVWKLAWSYLLFALVKMTANDCLEPWWNSKEMPIWHESNQC